MPRPLRRLESGLALILILATLLAACGSDDRPAASADQQTQAAPTATMPLRIVATTPLLGDLVRTLAQDQVELTTLVPPGRSPHLYEATADDRERLTRADLVVSHGLGCERGLAPALAGLPGRVVHVAVGDSISPDRILTTRGEIDPHVWYDTYLWGICARVLSDALSEIDGANGPAYERRLIGYRRSLDRLRDWARQVLASVGGDQRLVVTPHAGLAYLGRDFGLETRSLLGVAGPMSREPAPETARLAELATLLAGRGVPAIFSEVTLPAASLEPLVAASEGRGHPLAVAGPLLIDTVADDAGGADSHLGLFRHDVLAIVDALGAGDGH